MTGKDIVYFIVLAWNGLRKPATQTTVDKAVLDIVERVGDETVDLTDHTFLGYCDALKALAAVDFELVSRLFIKRESTYHWTFSVSSGTTTSACTI